MTNITKTTSSAREREIFLGALERSARERLNYIESACGEDRSLRQRVDDLLREESELGGFLEQPAATASATPLLVNPPPAGASAGEILGSRIGRYKLLQKIGEGGVGVVYMAEQEEPVRRRVALKVVKLGMDTQNVIARFEAERQALAMMDHPNIAKVLDAGATETGRPFFVMELVRGIKITDYCDQNNLPTVQRLRLFIDVCQAIQHAHQKGIIHRDIKPSNILVTLHDGVPVPKVIDFGIAKATEHRLTEKTLFTEFSMFIGTPAYMSPEQAEMSGLDVDTRSDIYALGVLLYELLTGKTPFDSEALLSGGLDACRRAIREQEPTPPSTRLSTMLAAELTATAKQRHLEPPQLIHLLRGDLDWIAMKCLEKDRTRRYETASSLALDIQRHLEGLPVLARPPSTWYRCQKFVRRHKLSVTAIGATTLVLLLAVIVSSWLAVRATRAEREQTRLRTAAELASQREARERQRAETGELAALRRAYNSDMNLIQQAFAANNYGRVADLLDRHLPKAGQPDLRQWEWRYYWNQSRSQAEFALSRQSNSIEAVVISPNGRLLAASDKMGALKLWDLNTQAEVAVLRKPGLGKLLFAFSKDGDRLAVIEDTPPARTTIKLWTVATRQVVAEADDRGRIEALAFHPDDIQLLLCHDDQSVRSWNPATREFTEILPGVESSGWPGYRYRELFSPDGKQVAVGDNNGKIQLVDLATGDTVSEMQAFDGPIASLAFSPDGAWLAASSFFTAASTTIKLFTTADGREAGQFLGHASWVPSLTFTRDGRRLISAGTDQSVRIWDLTTRREVATLRGHRSEVTCVAVSGDGQTIVSGCKDGTILGWPAVRDEHQLPYATLPQRVKSILFLLQGREFLSVGPEGMVSLWDADALREKEHLATLAGGVSHLLLSPDGARLFAGMRSGNLLVLDWATRLVVTNLPASGAPIPRGRGGPRPEMSAVPLGFADQGRTLVIAGPGGTIRLVDTGAWREIAAWKSPDNPPFFRPEIAVSPQPGYLLLSTFEGQINLCNLTNGQIEAAFPVSQNFGSSMSCSPDGQWLATASAEGTVSFWDLPNRKLVEMLRGHLLGAHGVAFSPDGQRLASGSHGSEAVKLWDVTTRHEVATLAGEGSFFSKIQFSPDGKLLVAINGQGKAHLWRAPSLDEIAAVEQHRAGKL